MVKRRWVWVARWQTRSDGGIPKLLWKSIRLLRDELEGDLHTIGVSEEM